MLLPLMVLLPLYWSLACIHLVISLNLAKTQVRSPLALSFMCINCANTTQQTPNNNAKWYQCGPTKIHSNWILIIATTLPMHECCALALMFTNETTVVAREWSTSRDWKQSVYIQTNKRNEYGEGERKKKGERKTKRQRERKLREYKPIVEQSVQAGRQASERKNVESEK